MSPLSCHPNVDIRRFEGRAELRQDTVVLVLSQSHSRWFTHIPGGTVPLQTGRFATPPPSPVQIDETVRRRNPQSEKPIAQRSQVSLQPAED